MPIFYDPINLATNQLEQARIENLGTDPGSGVSGQIYYNTTANKLKYYNGTAWGFIDTTSTDNDFLTGLAFNTGNGILTATVQNQNSVTVDLDGRYALTGDVPTVGNGTLTVQGTGVLGGSGTFTANQSSSSTITITHDSQTRTDTTSTGSPAFGGTFTAVDSVSSNASGHITAINLKTLTLPTPTSTTDNYVDSVAFSTANGTLTLGRTGALADLSVDLDGRYLESNETITLSGDVTGSGTTAITTTISAGAVDFAMINSAVVITEAEGISNNDNDVTLPTSAAVKAYADSLIVGGLIYQGGYNAATNSPDLDSSPSSSIKKGWTYTVTTAGNFFTEAVEVGDVLIAETNAPTALTDWTTVQNNVDLADLTTVGIGNVNAATTGSKDGLAVSYSSGTASVGLDVTSLVTLNQTPASGDSLIIYDTNQAKNKNITVSNLLSGVNSSNTYATTISATATITHSLGTKDVIVQLYDTVTDLTVYARIDRISTSQATITFNPAPSNSVRVLVQKIG
tara:strand:+ start:785 stop:2323 length:1539 start_codon:yes stop_codon:yes gene_type:complete